MCVCVDGVGWCLVRVVCCASLGRAAAAVCSLSVQRTSCGHVAWEALPSRSSEECCTSLGRASASDCSFFVQEQSVACRLGSVPFHRVSCRVWVSECWEVAVAVGGRACGCAGRWVGGCGQACWWAHLSLSLSLWLSRFLSVFISVLLCHSHSVTHPPPPPRHPAHPSRMPECHLPAGPAHPAAPLGPVSLT